MFHTVYKTTNRLNGNYYFGYHKTKKPDDSYLGSGLYIQRAVRKYGVGAFQKDVLFVYLDSASAFGKEAELVEAFRADPLCQNIRQGGIGGFDYINRNGLAPKVKSGSGNPHFGKKQTAKNRAAVRAANLNRVWSVASRNRVGASHQGLKYKVTPEGRAEKQKAVAKANAERVWTQESRSKLSASKKNLKWVTRDMVSKRVLDSQIEDYTKQGWSQGRR